MADVLAVRDEYRAQNWAMVVQECSNSGISNREFCRQRGTSEKTYYYWLRKLRSQMTEASSTQLVQLESAYGIDPYEYLLLVLSMLPYLGESPAHEELEKLMPWNPAVRHREHIRK